VKKIGFSLMVLVMFLSGCTNKYQIVEEIAPTILYYFERGKEEKYRVSTMVPPIKKEKRTVLTTEETMLKDVRDKINTEYFREVVDGQLRLIFFSAELVKDEGIQDIIHSLYMDTYISDRIYLGIVEGDFKEILKQNSETDYLLYREMEHNQNRGEIVVTDLHEFLKMLHSPYADPYLPYFKVQDKNLHYQGVALMKNYKMIDDLNLLESKIYNFLLNNIKYHDVIPLPTLQVSIGLVNSDMDIKMDHQKKSITLNLNLRGIINEYQGDKNLANRREQKELKKEITKEIKKQTTEIIKTLQRHDVDPLQLGLHTKSMVSQQYSGKEWKKAWPEYKVQMEIDLNIKDFGIYQEKEEDGV
jgi:spore germination protein